MAETIVHLEKRECYSYPKKETFYHPAVCYPEYPFGSEAISATQNEVYDMVRASLIGLGLDKEHYETPQWNPFGDFIKPGDKVVLKPNWVRQCVNNVQWDCTVTNPAVVRAAIDYCVIAKAGEIIVGDAPIQGMTIELVWEQGGYLEMQKFYSDNGVRIEIVDFRDLIVRTKNGLIIPYDDPRGKKAEDLVNLDFGSKSNHEDIELKKKYATCGYCHDKINENHKLGHHNYILTRHALEADVIINLPKPKTHRFAGITGAQKNFIGVCADKESLPHFTVGSPCVGGDETNSTSWLSKLITFTYDKYLIYCKQKKFFIAQGYRIAHFMLNRLNRTYFFTKGAWYGNDTIWKTILDVNKAVLYGDKNGILDFSCQKRKVFTIGDMIIAGQKAGPLEPDPKPLGIILASKNCAVFDSVFCKITGFDPNLLPTIMNCQKDSLLFDGVMDEVLLCSNLAEVNGKKIAEIEFPCEWSFEPHPYWTDVLSKKENEGK